jgi:hypothetical protein
MHWAGVVEPLERVVKPTPQEVQVVLRVALENDPTAHTAQGASPSDEDVPSAHISVELSLQ